MTEKEKRIIHDNNYTGLKHISADEIGELMKYATGIEGADKIGNVLFDAITKAFALGYYRGKGKG